jgi:hypothetical protein
VKIIGVMSWYDESASWLAASVAGFGRFCDTIIAVDGAYALYPQARARSMPEQSEAILQAAEAVGAGCIIHRPQDVWFGNEVEKRNHTLDLARAIGVEGEDWVCVFDADFTVMQAYPEAIRDHLSRTAHHVATYTILDGKDLMADEEQARIAQEIDVSTEWTVRTRSIYRLLPELRYDTKHWNVVGDLDDGRSVTLFGSAVEQVPEARLENALVVYHRRQARAKVRNQAAEAYYALRDSLGAEQAKAVEAAA